MNSHRSALRRQHFHSTACGGRVYFDLRIKQMSDFHRSWILDCVYSRLLQPRVMWTLPFSSFPPILCFPVPEDLSLEERDELSNIRRRKRELLDDIEVRLAVMQNVALVIKRSTWTLITRQVFFWLSGDDDREPEQCTVIKEKRIRNRTSALIYILAVVSELWILSICPSPAAQCFHASTQSSGSLCKPFLILWKLMSSLPQSCHVSAVTGQPPVSGGKIEKFSSFTISVTPSCSMRILQWRGRNPPGCVLKKHPL